MSGYPVIMNGDHAEFEREHANTPPHERPDWPLPSFDARDWAAAFCKINPNGPGEDVMIGWFANALMRGFDEHAARQQREAKPTVADLEALLSDEPDTPIRINADGSITPIPISEA